MLKFQGALVKLYLHCLLENTVRLENYLVGSHSMDHRRVALLIMTGSELLVFIFMIFVFLDVHSEL